MTGRKNEGRQILTLKSSDGRVFSNEEAQAALDAAREERHAQIEAILPFEAFEAFKVAAEAPGKKVHGLGRAAKATKGILKDAG